MDGKDLAASNAPFDGMRWGVYDQDRVFALLLSSRGYVSSIEQLPVLSTPSVSEGRRQGFTPLTPRSGDTIKKAFAFWASSDVGVSDGSKQRSRQ